MLDVEFLSDGVICRGWSFPPESQPLTNEYGAPVTVMAHGFSATRDMGLEPYARRFAAAGMHVLVFDYRHFGASDGEPRQLLSVGRQIQDWLTAVAFVRSIKGVDGDRVALFGTSFSGGHVVEVALLDGHVAAVVSQCPAMDGLAALTNVFRYAGVIIPLRLAWLSIKDMAYSLLGWPPVLVQVVARPGELGIMTTPDALPGMDAIAGPGWRNEVCARIALLTGLNRPGLKAGRLSCPILIQICEKDSVAPPKSAEAAAVRAGKRATVKRYPMGHFEVYVGQAFEKAVADQVDFLRDALASNGCSRA